MRLVAGARLGSYEIIGSLGAGGMGEVFRARDTRLDRDVAIKVLPSHLSFDPDMRARFEREARAVAALSHPNILAIHDIGAQDGTVFAVTELLEGETLRARLGGDGAGGAPAALPPRKGLEIAIQIARGLAAAHGKGIVHRDLKPENIFLTKDGHTKILDFGLAHTTSRGHDSGSATELRATDPGTVMGTAGYMAPEQVRGQPIDHRADIFAFGCVLYEMLGGRRAFQKDTAAETMTSVLKEEPPALTTQAAGISPALESIVSHCLEKAADDRFQSARDLTFALESAAGSSPALSPPSPASVHYARPPAWRWLAATIALCAATGLIVFWITGPQPPPAGPGPAIRAELSLPGFRLPLLVGKDDTILALSRDGRHLVSVTPDHTSIVLRDLETGDSRVLVKGGEVGEPIFSPDGQFVAFVQGGGGTNRTAVWGAIRKIAITGGASTLIADGVVGVKGAAWGEDGYIYYCPAPGMGLWRAPADGRGTPEKLTDPNAAAGEKTHRHPFVLPGARALLFTVGTSRITSFDDARIEALDLTDMSRHRLVEGGTAPRYLPTGHLLYARAGQLVAIAFDSVALTVSGAPVVVADGIADLSASGTSYHAVSDTGLLVYIPRGPTPEGQIVSVDRQGRTTRLAEVPARLTSGSLSPDGSRLAIDPDGATQQIVILDLARNIRQQLTYEWDNANPLWTADGSRLVFRANLGGGRRRLYWQAADGTGAPELLTPATAGDRDEIPTSIHGDIVVYENLDPVSKMDIWMLSLTNRQSQPLVQTPFDEGGARLSPDGHWLAYQSNQSGRWEVWVQRYPSGARQQVSQGGGARPMWLPDSKAVVFQARADVLATAISASGAAAPVRLFGLEPNDVLLDATADGRFLVSRTTAQPPTSVGLIVNWFDEVRRRVAGETGDQ